MLGIPAMRLSPARVLRLWLSDVRPTRGDVVKREGRYASAQIQGDGTLEINRRADCPLEPRWNPGPRKSGRGGRIRTGGPLRPSAMLCDVVRLAFAQNAFQWA